jgi:hypothetical protein
VVSVGRIEERNDQARVENYRSHSSRSSSR